MPRTIIPALPRYRRRRVPRPGYPLHALVRLPTTTLLFLPTPLPQPAIASSPSPSPTVAPAPRIASAPVLAAERGRLVAQHLPRFLHPLDIPLCFLELSLISGGEFPALAFFQGAEVGDG